MTAISETQQPQDPALLSPPPKPKKRNWGWFLLGIIVMAALSSFGTMYALNTFFIPKSQTPVAPVLAFKAKVMYVTGLAWKMTDNRRVEIKENDTLSQGDEITTEDNTKIVLLFDDGSILRIGDSSTIVLTQLKPEEMTFNEKRGTLFARVNKDAQHQFIIQAGAISVRSLGTAFAVENQDEVKVKVFESKVTVIDEDKKETSVEIGQQWQESVKEVKKLSDSEVASNHFLTWSLTQDQGTGSPSATPKPTEKPPSTPTPTANPNARIALSASTTDNGINLSWQPENIDITKGFKVIKGLNENPTYPKDNAVFKESSVRSFIWEIKDGKTYHLRVCQYLGDGKCGAYSNDVAVKAPGSESSNGQVKSLNLVGEKTSSNEVRLRWTVDGTSPQGYKVVWSKNSGPTYPTRDGDQFHYLSSPEKRDDTVSDLESGKTYYFRVCQYLGGSCGTYSNEVSLGM